MPVSLASAPATTHGAVVPIAYQTFNGSSSGVTFSNIPQGYQDLMLVVYGRDTRAVVNEVLLIGAFNGDTGSNYSYTWLFGTGSSASSSRQTNISTYIAIQDTFTGSSAGTGIYGSGIVHILNYANSTTNKTIIGRGAADANGSGQTSTTVGLWRGTNAISSMTVGTYNNLASGSTIALYGIRSVNQ